MLSFETPMAFKLGSGQIMHLKKGGIYTDDGLSPLNVRRLMIRRKRRHVSSLLFVQP